MSTVSSEDLINLTSEADVSTSSIERRDEAHEEKKLEHELPSAPSREVALELALSAADLSMRALRLAKDSASKKELTVKVKALLQEAERIKYSADWNTAQAIKDLPSRSAQTVNAAKVRKLNEPKSTRELPKSEQILVLKASSLNGMKFPPWKGSPAEIDFQLRDGEALFLDNPVLPLSHAQSKVLDGWKRAEDALPPPSWYSQREIGAGATMAFDQKVDLVQDAATDCSVVASLCALTARGERGHAKILPSIFYPYDLPKFQPKFSPNGKYILKLNFNGAYRRVEIDDRLPVSNTRRVMHVVDRRNPGLLWPSLIEKAYLKVRGGYDFPGSNSGTDLWILTGWIPEQVFLQSEDTSPDDVWRRMFGAHSYGDVLVTMGTGPISNRAEREIGLAGEHDYAVLDMKEIDGQKLMLVKNPWCEGTSWRGGITRHGSNDQDNASAENIESEPLPSPGGLLNADDELSPGTFWIDLHSVAQHFESIYLNWNPGLFSHRQDLHFPWDLTTHIRSTSFISHPQFTIDVARSSTVWLLLCRHFQDMGHETGQSVQTSQSSVTQMTGFVSLYVFDNGGSKVFVGEGSVQRGPFVDSPQTLLRLDNLEAHQQYTVVPAEHDLPLSLNTFTLSVFANAPLTLGHASNKYAYQKTMRSSWSEGTAGGNAHSPTYSQNPQYSIAVSKSTAIALLLETGAPHLNLHVKLVHGRGLRVQNVRSRDIVFDSKDYRRQCALAEYLSLDAGTYTIICSTFEAGQTGDFTLRVESEVEVQLSQLPREGAGRIKMPLSTAVMRAGQHKIAAPVVPRRLTKAVLLVKHLTQYSSSGSKSGNIPRVPSPKQGRSMLRVTLELGTGPCRRILIASSNGEYSDSASGIRTDEIDLTPAMIKSTTMWLVIERMFTPKNLPDEVFQVEMYIDAVEAVGVGVWRRWDE